MVTAVYIALAFVTATLVAALFGAPACSLGYRPMLSGYTVIIYTMLLYIALSAAVPIFMNGMVSFDYPAYSSPQSFFDALIVCWIGIVAFVGFYWFFTRNRRGASRQAPAALPSALRNPPIVYAIILLGVAMKILFVHRMGGLHTIIIARSGGLAKNMGIELKMDEGDKYLLELSFIADAASTWLFLRALQLRRGLIVQGALLAAVLAASFITTPKREVLLPQAFALVLGFGTYVRPLRLKYAPIFVFAAVASSMLTLLGRIMVPMLAAGLRPEKLLRNGAAVKFGVHLLSEDINFFDATMVAVSKPQDVVAKFGSWWEMFYRPNFEPFVYVIPRSVWPSKPTELVDVSSAMRAIEQGLQLHATVGGNGIGLIGTSWLFGGALGLFCGMGLLGLAAAYTDRYLAKMHYATPGRILICAVSFTTLFHFFRQGSIGWTLLDFVQTIAAFWLVAIFLTYLASRNAQPRSPQLAEQAS